MRQTRDVPDLPSLSKTQNKDNLYGAELGSGSRNFTLMPAGGSCGSLYPLMTPATHFRSGFT